MNDLNPQVRTALSLVIMVIVVWLMHYLQSILIPVLFSVLLAMALYPLAAWLERWLPRVLAAILSVIVAFAAIFGLLFFIVDQVIVIGSDSLQFDEIYDHILTAIQNFVTERLGLQTNDLWDQFKDSSMKIVSNASSYLTKFFGSAGNIVANGILVPLYVFFFLYYRAFFLEFIYRAFARSPKDRTRFVLDKINSVIRSYLLGLVMVMGIVAVLNTIGLLVMKIEYAWFFGILAALLLLIPYIGIAIGSLIPALFALATKDSAYYALGVVIWFQIVQTLEGNLITPNVVGGKVNINAMVAIIALFLGGKLFGLAGLVLAMPMIATLKIILDASQNYTAIGFLLGLPEERHLRTGSAKQVLEKVEGEMKRSSDGEE